MKIFKQLAIIIGVSFVGNLLSEWLHLPIPGSITGMLLMLILLLSGIVKERDIAQVGNFILKNMSFFFVPACVGVLGTYKLLNGYYLQTISVVLLSTILVIATTAIVSEFFIKKTDQTNDDNNR